MDKSNNYFNELRALTKFSVNKLTNVFVAAIIVTDKGIFNGVNYEDIIPALSICAERNAIYSGITKGMKKIYEIHILSPYKDMSMCGVCRQLASNFTTNKTMVYVYDIKTGKRSKTPFSKLLPNCPKIDK